MVATIRWDIESMECFKQEQQYSDVVYNIHWRLYAIDGEYSTSMYGTQTVSFDPTVPGYQFVPYAELEEETVKGWLFGALGAEQVSEKEQLILGSLSNIMNPPTEVKPVPWVSPLIPPTEPSPMEPINPSPTLPE